MIQDVGAEGQKEDEDAVKEDPLFFRKLPKRQKIEETKKWGHFLDPSSSTFFSRCLPNT